LRRGDTLVPGREWVEKEESFPLSFMGFLGWGIRNSFSLNRGRGQECPLSLVPPGCACPTNEEIASFSSCRSDGAAKILLGPATPLWGRANGPRGAERPLPKRCRHPFRVLPPHSTPSPSLEPAAAHLCPPPTTRNAITKY